MNTSLLKNSFFQKLLCVAVIMVLVSPFSIVSAGCCIGTSVNTPDKNLPESRQEKSKIFLIVVTDTNDKEIGERCETDLNNIEFEFEDLADLLEVKIVTKSISGDEFSKTAVLNAVNSWLPLQHPQSTDMVVFYYSGHGFRNPGDVSDYPRIWLKTETDQDVQSNNLQMEEDIYKQVMKAGAGVNLVISDCCNADSTFNIADFAQVAVPAHVRKDHNRASSANGNDDDDLFYSDILLGTKHPYSLLVTAAAKGEYAGGKPSGGFFTNYFLEAFEKCVFDEDIKPDWDSIMSYTDKNAGYWAKSGTCPEAKHTQNGRCIQTVTYEVNTIAR